MMLFGSNEPPEHHLSDERIAAALSEIKQGARDRRIAMVAPLVLAAAVLTAFVAAPPQHGGITLVPEADASNEALLPRVFGANGVSIKSMEQEGSTEDAARLVFITHEAAEGVHAGVLPGPREGARAQGRAPRPRRRDGPALRRGAGGRRRRI